MGLTTAEKRQLEDLGFLVLNHFMDGAFLAQVRDRVQQLFAQEGTAAGADFLQEEGCQRLANLLNKGTVFQELVSLPRLLEYVCQVLGPEFKLSSLNARSVPPGSGLQPLHADMAAVADEQGFWVCNTVWLLDDFTADNGSLRLVPGSHHWRRLPQQELSDPRTDHPGQILVTGRAGSVIVVNAHAWHAGTANHTDRPRTALHAFYCRRDKPQQQYQKRLLRAEVQQGLSAELRHLLALDDARNDELSAAVAVRSGFLN
jgi:Phytanoyl-CoA dioxygenase (PhyH)